MLAGPTAYDFIMGFQGDPLASIGMTPSHNNPRECGVLFEGDGVRTSGTYFSWADGNGRIVSVVDFQVLEEMPFSMELPEFIAVRHDTIRYPGRNEVTAFAGVGKRSATTHLRKEMRCSYVEVEYLGAYLEERLCDTASSVQNIMNMLSGMSSGITWSPEIARPFEAIERCDSTGTAAELVFSGAADMLIGTLLGMERAPLLYRDEHEAIAPVLEYIDRNLDKPLRQEGMLGLAGMSAAKFKKLFKRFTGESMSDYIASHRIERAKLLLLQGESVGRVSKDVGFEMPTSFATAFKRATGQTPTQWRRRSRIQALPPTDDTMRRIYLEEA